MFSTNTHGSRCVCNTVSAQAGTHLPNLCRVAIDWRKVQKLQGHMNLLGLRPTPEKNRLRQLGTPHLQKCIVRSSGERRKGSSCLVGKETLENNGETVLNDETRWTYAQEQQ